MSSLKLLNPHSESVRQHFALLMNVNAAIGLCSVMKTNLGPRGTLKMLVGGAGDIKLTKDGRVLLHEMQIQHPTAALIARTATAQDDVTGDGTTSVILLVAEFLKQCERFLSDGVHPRILAEGFEVAKTKCLELLNEFKVDKEMDRELLTSVAATSLRSKVAEPVADILTDIVVEAVKTIERPGEPLDLFMIEIMTMQHRRAVDTALIKGLVLDHGPRHPAMPRRLKNAFILVCNVSFEYEKPEQSNVSTIYSSAEERDRMVEAEHKRVDDKVRKVIDLARTVIGKEKEASFVVINQKGIDPMALDMFAKEGIMALRRAKRRNMERLTRACGGVPVNSVEDLTPEVLGKAGLVYTQTLGEQKYTFVEKVENPFSCTIFIRGPNKHTILQVKDACRDGIRAVYNAIGDKCLVPGGGAFEVYAYRHLMKFKDTVAGKPKLGVQAFAEAVLIIPKTLAENSGLDPQDAVLALADAQNEGLVVGLDLVTGDPMDPEAEGVWDNFRVKRQMLYSSSVIASQLLLVDEVMKAGKSQAAPQGQ